MATTVAKELEKRAIGLRKNVLKYIKLANAGHTGGSLSCLDILNVLYNGGILNVSPASFGNPDRDRYVQSKGHSVEALYVTLASAGFFPESDLETLCRYQSHYVGHPTRKIAGIEQNTGALGHGLSFAVGVGISAKLSAKSYRAFTLLGDGELAEGSNWEAALTASQYQLDNVVAILDCNTLQITGRTKDVCDTEPLEQKFAAFGWSCRRINGHDYSALLDTLGGVPFEREKPSIVIADTTKGKGVSFMEDVGRWHHGVPDDSQYASAMAELETAEAAAAAS